MPDVETNCEVVATMLGMRLFITSTAEELEAHRSTAEGVARELGIQVLAGEPDEAGREGVSARERRVATADGVLALLSHRPGEAPPPEHGGDGLHSWAWWEIRAAFDRGLPLRVLMTRSGSDSKRPEDDPIARSVLQDFRAELARLAELFDGDDLEHFRVQVREALVAIRAESQAGNGAVSAREMDRASAAGETGLRRWPSSPLPPSPYPVLLPYTHPDLLAGRDWELAEITRLLARPVPILGLYAVSGAGKSSILGGGLVPGLRGDGRPVAFDRRPREPGIVRRLVDDLLAEPANLDDEDCHGFVDLMRGLRNQGGVPPILILDQLESLFGAGDDGVEDAGTRRARSVVAALLAASVQRLPGLGEPPCRWLLVYRQELHGRIFQWLRDLSRDLPGNSSGPILPHDLAGADRFQSWVLPPLGTPPPGAPEIGDEDRSEAVARIFRAVIEKPLGLLGADDRPVYPYRFAVGDAERLARFFAAARLTQRTAPLAPELQVVLAHLLRLAVPGVSGTSAEVRVPRDPRQLLDHALEEHLGRSLDFAFPARKLVRRDHDSRIQRTRALLALRELADSHGRSGEGRPAGTLARAIGEDGHDVLERLATAQTRIVFLESAEGDSQEPVYRLAHDRMTEVIVRQVDDEGTYAGLGIDTALLALRRFVALQRQLYSAGEEEQATTIPPDHFGEIERHADCLLWDEHGRRWWRACRERQRRDRKRAMRRVGLAAVIVGCLILVVGLWASQALETRERLDTVERGDAAAAFAALARLSTDSGVDRERLVHRLSRRRMPFDVLERGLGDVEPAARGSAVLRVTELLLPLQRAVAPKDPRWIASIVWALDFFAWPEPALQSRAEALRAEVLQPLRAEHPPPPLPSSGDPAWAVIPSGSFRMGLDPGEEPDGDPFEETPSHRVMISAFRLQTHEVTFGEYRRLVPEFPHREPADFPAGYLNWYEAYTYAAWLGGRLPTEAEWEYAARAGCPHAFCKHDGSQADIGEVAWWVGNSVDVKSDEPGRKPVGLLEPNPWGLFDIHGNVHEWIADWAGPYSLAPATNPPGPVSFPGYLRITRGGCAVYSPFLIGASRRGGHGPEARIPQIGFRVAMPFQHTMP